MTTTANLTASISKSESVTLIKNMIRIAVSSICYFREIFEPELFTSKNYGNIEIYQLQAVDPKVQTDESGSPRLTIHDAEAFLITQWFELGVFTALEQGYLSSILFAIFGKLPGAKEESLLESYEFRLSYEDGHYMKINDAEMASKDAVKAQAAKFIRSLIEFARTLDPLPGERTMSVELRYRENTPTDYEPQFFTAGTTSFLTGKTLPLRVNIGQLKTPSLEMKVRYAGLENLLFQEPSRPEYTTPTPIKQASAFNAKDHRIKSPPTVSMDQESEVDEKLGNMNLKAAPTVDPNKNKQIVKDFLVSSSTKNVSVKKCIEALQIQEAEVRDILKELATEKIVIRKGSYYTLVAQTSAISKFSGLTPAPIDAVGESQIDQDSTNNFGSMKENFDSASVHNVSVPSTIERMNNVFETPNKQAEFVQPSKPRNEPVQSEVMISSQQSDLDQPATKIRKISQVKDPLHMQVAVKKQKLM